MRGKRSDPTTGCANQYIPDDTRGELPHTHDDPLSNENVSNSPTERPWPPPPGQNPDQDQDISFVPAEPGLRPTEEPDADGFPLWPTAGTAVIDGEEVDGIVIDRPLPPPAYLGAPGPDRVRSEDFATVVLDAVAAHRVPLVPMPLPGGRSSPTSQLASAPEAREALDPRAAHAATEAFEVSAAFEAPDGLQVRAALDAPAPFELRAALDAPAPFELRAALEAAAAFEVRAARDAPDAFEVPASPEMPAREAPVPDLVWPVDPSPGLASSGSPAPPVQGKKRKEAPEQWPPPEMRAMSQARSSTARVLAPRVAVRGPSIRHLRRPGPALAWLLVFALLAAFFAYTAAEPTWLALGHATRGTATVVRCQDAGVFRRCDADFVSGRFEATDAALIGADRVPGATVPARMVGAHGRIAYAGSNRSLLLHGLVGLVLVLLCGLGIAWATGAGRLGSRRTRNVARLLSVGLPLLIATGVLAATY